MPRQPEGRLLQKVLRLLRGLEESRWVKIHGSEDSYQEVGIPDILGCYRGHAVAIETKTTVGKLSPKQELFLASWERAGGYTLVARSVEEVKGLIAEIDDLEDNEKTARHRRRSDSAGRSTRR